TKEGKQVQREQKGFLGPLKGAVPGLRETLPERKPDTTDVKRKAVEALRKDPKNTALLDDAVKAGTMTPAQRKEIINEAKLAPIEVEFRNKSLEDALKYYRQATPQQKAQLRELLLDKWRNASGEARRSKK